MDSVKLVPLLVGLLIAVVMVGAVFVPVVQSSTTRTITTEIENEGAEWLKLGYNQGTDYSFTVGFDGEDNFTVGTQTGEYKNLICYADNERTLFVSGDNWYLLTNGENPSVHKFTDTASVTNASGTLTITDGETTVYTGASPTWAYVPDANGVYGFFTDGGLELEEGKPTVAVGSYAGVFAYNETVVYSVDADLGLTMSGNYADGEVIWIVAPSELDTLSVLPTDTLEPAVVDLDPISIQPIDLGGSGSVGLMSADPTNGTRVGDLYYTFSGTDATIVGYSSEIDWATFTDFPDTVTNDGNTYTITKIGLRAFQDCASLNVASLPEGLEEIGSYAFRNCTALALTSLPEGVTTISGYNVFSGCTSLALTSLPEGVTTIGSGNCFSQCTALALTSLPEGMTAIPSSAFSNSGITNFYIPEGVTTIGDTAFSNCSELEYLIVGGSPTIGNNCFSYSGIKEVLNLGQTEITTTSYGLNADSVQDHVTALGYIAPTSIHESEVVPIDSPVAGLMQLLPLIAGIGALFLAVGTMIYTRF